jgi:hypothetical protein
MIMNESGTDADNLVGADGSAYAAAANRNTSGYLTRGYGTREWNYYVGIVVRGVELMCPEIDNIMACCAQPVEQLFF